MTKNCDSAVDSKPAFPAGRCIPYSYCADALYYPYGNTPIEDFLRYDWKETDSSQRERVINSNSNPSILALGCGDIRCCIGTLVTNFHPSLSGIIQRDGISFYLNDRCNSIHARNVIFLHILLKNAGTRPRKWIPSLWSIWYCHELLPQHVEMLQDTITDLLSLSESAEKWTSSEALICSLCHFEEDTLRDIRSIWKFWLKFLSCKQDITIEAVKNTRDKSTIRANFLQHTRELVLGLVLNARYPYSVLDAMASDIDAYLKEGSAFAETVFAISGISTQRVLNPTFFENNTYKLCCFIIPYASFNHEYFYSVENLLQWYPGMQEEWFIDKKGFENHPLLSNSVSQFTMYHTAAARILTSKQGKAVKFYFNNLDAIVYCQILSNLSLKFDCVDSSNLIDYLSPLLLLVAVMPLVCDDGVMKSITMIFRDVVSTVKEYLPRMFGFHPNLLPTMFGIKYCFPEKDEYVATFPKIKIMWKHTNCTEPLKIDSLHSRPDIVDALVGLTKVTTTDEKLFNEFRMCAETAVLSYCCFASNLHCEVPIESFQFWDSLCLRLRQDGEMQKYLLHIQTQALLHKLHFHLAFSANQCALCCNQLLRIFHFEVDVQLLDTIDNHGLYASLYDTRLSATHKFNSLAYSCNMKVKNRIAVNFFVLSTNDNCFAVSIQSSKSFFTPAAIDGQCNSCPYSFVRVHRRSTSTTHAIQTIIMQSSGMIVECSSCGKKSPALKHCPCHLVAYCNGICQKTDWPVHRLKHKAVELKK